MSLFSPARALAEGLQEMIDSKRLTETDIPDDFQWLQESIADVLKQEIHDGKLHHT
jgi:predicted protein tyrosine phosphatase